MFRMDSSRRLGVLRVILILFMIYKPIVRSIPFRIFTPIKYKALLHICIFLLCILIYPHSLICPGDLPKGKHKAL